MTDTTRPGELSRSEAQRIAKETAALLKIADDERAFREHMLVSMARVEVKVDSLSDSFEKHVAEDDQRFGNVTQRINTNTSWISKGAGILAAMVVMLGVVMWVVDKVSP